MDLASGQSALNVAQMGGVPPSLRCGRPCICLWWFPSICRYPLCNSLGLISNENFDSRPHLPPGRAAGELPDEGHHTWPEWQFTHRPSPGQAFKTGQPPPRFYRIISQIAQIFIPLYREICYTASVNSRSLERQISDAGSGRQTIGQTKKEEGFL